MASSVPPDNREVLAVVRAWANHNYPGCPVEFVTIHVRYLSVPIQLAEGPVALALPVAPSVEEERDEHGPALHPVTKAILHTLRETGHPLTKTKLFEGMARFGYEYSERNVCRYLALLMEDGTVENPPDAKPRGYREVT